MKFSLRVIVVDDPPNKGVADDVDENRVVPVVVVAADGNFRLST